MGKKNPMWLRTYDQGHAEEELLTDYEVNGCPVNYGDNRSIE